MKPKVSVVIPFYNAGNTLNRALESIAMQSEGNFECLMVDNNSSDDSVEIAKKWETIDPRFKLYHENRQGVAFASNKGTTLAKGEYIARMDADDWAFNNRLKIQSEYLDKNIDCDVVAGCVEYVSHNAGQTDGFERYVHWNNSILTSKQIQLKRFIEMPLINPTCMWRKSSSEKYGMYQHGNFPEDYELWLRWLEKGAKIAKVSESVLKWCDSTSRLTRTNSTYSEDSFNQIKIAYLIKYLQKINIHHPKVVVWGASKTYRKRADLLESKGISIESYIDIKKSRQIGKKILFYKDIPKPGDCFILSYVTEINARNRIIDYLSSKGYVEGTNFLLVS